MESKKLPPRGVGTLCLVSLNTMFSSFFCFVFNICGFYTPTFVYKYGRASRACAESGDREGGRRTIYECACFSVQLVLYLRPFRAFTVVFIVVTQISEFVRRFPNLENARNFTKFLKFRPLTHEYRWLNITVYICFCFPSSNDFRTDTVEIGPKVHWMRMIISKLYKKYRLNNLLCLKCAGLSYAYVVAWKPAFHLHRAARTPTAKASNTHKDQR